MAEVGINTSVHAKQIVHPTVRRDSTGAVPSARPSMGREMREETLLTRRPSMDIARLGIVEVLRSVPREDLGSIAQNCRWLSVRKGQQILFHKDRGDEVVFLCSGRVRATIYSPGGKEIAYEELNEGAVFGEMAVLDPAPRSTHVVASDDTIIAMMPGDNFLDLVRKYPDVGIAVASRLCRTIRFLCARIFEFSALSVSERIESELLRVATERGFHGDSAEIIKPPTHAEIAARLNTHREAVTKHLNDLDRAGLITRKGRTLIIPDLDTLRERVETAMAKE